VQWANGSQSVEGMPTFDGALPTAPRAYALAYRDEPDYQGGHYEKDHNTVSTLIDAGMMPFHDKPSLGALQQSVCPGYVDVAKIPGWMFDDNNQGKAFWWRYFEKSYGMARAKNQWGMSINHYNNARWMEPIKNYAKINHPSSFMMINGTNNNTIYEQGSGSLDRNWFPGESWTLYWTEYRNGKSRKGKRQDWADNPLPHNGKHSVAFWDGHVDQTNFDEIIERGWQWEDWRK
jgi:prepilin-type processing-associated H-X9-DG protein